MNEIEYYISEYERIKHRIDAYEEQIKNLKLEIDKKIEELEKQINYFQNKYEKVSRPINDTIDETQKNLNKYSLAYKIFITLKDIINEISHITRIDTKDIKISGHRSYVHYPILESYNSSSNINEILKLIAENTKDPVNVNLSLYIKGQSPINITFDGYLSDTEADGKTLLEHSKTKPVEISSFVRPEDHKKSEIIGNFVMIDNTSIEKLICSFCLKQIIDFKENYENDLLSKAIINCLNKQKYMIRKADQTPVIEENNHHKKMTKQLKPKK